MNSTHKKIEFNGSTHDLTVKGETYISQMISAIILIPQFTNEKKVYYFRVLIIITPSLILSLLINGTV